MGQHQYPALSAAAVAGNFTDAINEPVNFLAGGVTGAAGANHAAIKRSEEWNGRPGSTVSFSKLPDLINGYPGRRRKNLYCLRNRIKSSKDR
ncbi:MAG TPA: hypothetical protein VFL79_01075 [Terriglobia bacterium]|nr:hypothetical protein [Terriglobia bacterium]